MVNKHFSAPRRMARLPSIKRMISWVMGFGRSPYYSWRIGMIWPLFLGCAYAMFPFEDMSLAYAVRPAVVATAIESTMIIAVIICWVMLVSYTLDRRYDWHKKLSRRLIFQICLGGAVPYGLLLVYLWQVYGLDMMLGEYMHFVYALFMVFLVILNRQGYIVYLLNKVMLLKSELQNKEQGLLVWQQSVQELTTEQRLAQERERSLREQLEFLHAENTSLGLQLEALRERELILVADLADKTAQLGHTLVTEPKEVYEMSFPDKESLFFEEGEISRFYIKANVKGKPLINLVTNAGEEFLIMENSLTALALRFKGMIHVGRKTLTGAHTLLSLTKHKKGAVELTLDYQDTPITVSPGRWKKIGAQVTQTLAERNKGI